MAGSRCTESTTGELIASTAIYLYQQRRAVLLAHARESVFIPQKSSRALSKSSLNPGAPYQRRLPSILRMRAENGLVRVFRRGVLGTAGAAASPWTISPDPGRGCTSATGGIAPLPPDQLPSGFRRPESGEPWHRTSRLRSATAPAT